jgi:hypothetical protein
VIDVQWWHSEYDNQVHAFENEQASRAYAEAVCEHSVPTGKITCTDEGRRCMACLLIVGDMLSQLHGDLAWRAS